MRFALLLALVLAAGIGPAAAQGSKETTKGGKQFSHIVEREKANESLVMLLGGALGGPWLQMAQDVALAVGESKKLRVLPVAGEGGKQNLHDVLLVRGVDLGITRLEVLNAAKASGEFGPNLERRISYIAALAVDMLQVLARPDITSLKDLDGKKVSILPKGSVVPSVLKTLGVTVEEVNLSFTDAMEQMRAGKIAASACFCSVPIPIYKTASAELGFKLLEIPYTDALEESYLPASIAADAYPNLIGAGGKVQTIGSNVVLISYNWAPNTDRYRRIEAFAQAFFTNFDKLREPSRHPTWRSVNPAATIRGWQRFAGAQKWLDRLAAESKGAGKSTPDGDAQAKAKAAAATSDPAEQERLFKEFLEWSRAKDRR
jgi:TRAP-type uncharacterized transport system substrate-binding protein